jgi:predicted acylesterase/phospholipase RssA
MFEERPLGASALLRALSPRLQEELLAAAESRRLPAQEWLFREGEPGDRLYVVRAGRLRVVADHEERSRVLRLLGPGAVLGELAVLTGAPRSASVQAVRDAELLEIDGGRFQDLLQQSPELGAALATALADHIQRGASIEAAEAPTAVVAIAAVEGAPGDRAWDELSRAFGALGDTVTLDSRDTSDAEAWDWGRHVAELERHHEHVLLKAELDGSEWSRFCLRQADRVVVLTPAAAPPPAAEVPDGCDVLFLEPPSTEDVAAWFAGGGVRAHHVLPVDTELPAAAGRVARRLTGQSLGLVLSGGGARTFAHIGVLEVLEAEGLEVDRLGGCSMGAFIGAMAALGWRSETMVEVCRRELAQRAPFSDYTIPRHSLIRARRAASMLKRLFGELALEQLARPLYTVSADLLSSRMVIHRTGSIVDTVGASMAIPGLAPPVSRQSQLLVDGGVLNNLPVDVMVADEPGPIVAVDVMRRLDAAGVDLEQGPLLPTIVETLSRATVLGSVERAESNRALAHVLVAPEVHDVSLRGFRNLDRVVEAGRRAAEQALADGGREALEEARRRGAPLTLAVGAAVP